MNRDSTQPSAVSTQPLTILVNFETHASGSVLWFAVEGTKNVEEFLFSLVPLRPSRLIQNKASARVVVDLSENVQGLNAEC